MKRAVILISAVIMASSLLNLGTIRKEQDPILKTQTDSISFQKKEEEMKDGPKGAPMPSFNLYPKAGFLNDPAVGGAKEEEIKSDDAAAEKITEVDTSEEESEDWWGEEDSETEEKL